MKMNSTLARCVLGPCNVKRLGLRWKMLSSVTEQSTKATGKNRVPVALGNPFDSRVTEVIDVRTPAEFEVDHIPGAMNLPVLDNIKHVEIGTLYKASPFEARKLGAAQVTKNIATHIESYLQTKPAEYSPLIYCKRGGQRSHSMAIVLSQIGFDTFVLEGGYKSYRNMVRDKLNSLPQNFKYKVISGLTGSGKTFILDNLRSHGAQVLDLEGLAKHKGSVLGLWHGETQPSQKYWESSLVQELRNFDENRPVWVESESRNIGRLIIPDELFSHMCSAEKFKVHLPLEERVKYICNTYTHWIEDKESLKLILKRLTKVLGHAKLKEWETLIDEEKWEVFVRSILTEHYDPTYSRSQKTNTLSSVLNTDVHLPDLSETTLSNLCENLIEGKFH